MSDMETLRKLQEQIYELSNKLEDYLTAEQTLSYSNRHSALHHLRLIADELNGETLWNRQVENHSYILGFNQTHIAIIECRGEFTHPGSVYFRTKELAQQALNYLAPKDREELFGDAKGTWE